MKQPEDNRQISLVRLAPDVDIGLVGVGITARVAEDGNVQLWLTIACGQPSPLDGKLHVEEILWRQVDQAPATKLIEQFNQMKDARKQPLVLVP